MPFNANSTKKLTPAHIIIKKYIISTVKLFAAIIIPIASLIISAPTIKRPVFTTGATKAAKTTLKYSFFLCKTLKTNADLRWNICTEAEEIVVTENSNKVLFLMCNSHYED